MERRHMRDWQRLGKGRRHNFLCILGHVNTDIIYSVPRLPEKGLSINTISVSERFGGTAGNMAINAAMLGIPTALGTYIGYDFSEEFTRMLIAAGIDVYDTIKLRGHRTPRCHIFDDGTEQSYVIEQGAMAAEGRYPLWRHAIASSSYVHVSTGDPLRYLSALKGRRYNFDPGQEISYRYTPSVLKRMMRGCDIFFCNRIELQHAARLLKLSRAEEIWRYCRAAICTEGARGAVIISKDGMRRIRAVKTRKVEGTVGAGDAFRAGFYAAFFHDMDMEAAVEVGNTMASLHIEGRRTTWEWLRRRWKREYG
jgi:sugar/nucleoside kinase (ribokinase family)